MNPTDLFAINFRLANMMWEAGTVMNLRLLAMAGALPARRGENKRMVDEKSRAIGQSYVAATSAMMAGKPPAAVIDAAMKPISRRVSSNHKRLTKR